MRFFLLLLLLIQGTTAIEGDTPVSWTGFKHTVKFGNLSVEDGLSQSSVLCIIQDHRGFMWFGTEDGLNRFDGHRFKPFRPEPGNPGSLNHNIIFSLFEDSRGNLWVGTNGGGVNIFDRETEQFSHYKFSPAKDGNVTLDNIYRMVEDSRGHIWIGTEGGLLKCRRMKSGNSLVFDRILHNPDNPFSISHNAVNSIYEDGEGTLWFGTDGGGLNRLDSPADSAPGSFSFSRFNVGPGASNRVMAVTEDHQGTMWVGTQDGLFSFDRATGRFKRQPVTPGDSRGISHHYIRLIYKDRANVPWIGTDGGGLNKLVPGKTKDDSPSFRQFQFDPGDPDSLSGNGIQAIFEDRSGVLWVGVYRGGVNKLVLGEPKGFNREREQFVHYRARPNIPNSLSHNNVNAICEDGHGNLWVGTDGGGLNRAAAPKSIEDPLTFRHYFHDPKDPGSLSDNIVITLREDRQGNLWIGTYTGGLNKWAPGPDAGSPGRFIHYKNQRGNPNSLSNNFVMTIYEDRSGHLWVGNIQGGMNRYHPESDNFTRFRNNPDDPGSLSDNNVFAIFQDRSGTLWVGTAAGLNRMIPGSANPGKNPVQFHRYLNDPANPESISGNFIRTIYQDRSGTLWIGTNSGGLNRYHPGASAGAPGSFTHYRRKDGLPGDVIVGILEDDGANLWLSTTKGLSRFNPQTGVFKNFDMRDGLQGNEFNRGAYFKGRGGEMFFGGINGFNIFHPGRIRENSHVPTIAITDFQLFNRSVPIGKEIEGRILLEKSITATRHLTLSHRDYVFSFHFAALDYVNSSKNSYQYFMEGLDRTWNEASQRRTVTYTTLPHGEYVFRVRGANNDGVRNHTGIALKITVTPPFYQTWWFYAIIVLLFIFTALGIHQYRVRKIIHKMKKKYEKTAIRPDKAEVYLKTLLNYMKIGKPYLDQHLTLRELAKKVAIPHHYLSQIINDKLNKIFFDFINQYRIEEAMNKLSHPKERQKTIHQVAHEVGFNSQSAFNRAFKKHTRTTPFDYINQCRIKDAVEILSDAGQKKKSIHQVAGEVGFNSISSFNRAFKKTTGQSPTQFRNHPSKKRF
jgi:ligand-binding sensor domain-containing protein/AraC-like DNA-binding protein